MAYAKHISVIGFILLLSWTSLVSQQKLDSLLAQLDTDLSTRELIKTHNRVARIYINQDTTAALFHRDKMDSISQVTNDTLGRFLVAAISNIHYFNIAQYEKSELELKKQLRLADDMDNDNFKTGINYEMSLVKRAQNDLDSAIYYAEVCYSMIEENPKVPLLNKVLTLNHLGELSQQKYDYKQALQYYFKSDSLSSSVSNYQVNNYRGDVQLSIGKMYLMLKDSSNAKNYYTKAVDLYQVLDNKRGQSKALHQIGKLYLTQGKDSSLFYLSDALDLQEGFGKTLSVASISRDIGDYWFSRDNEQKALSEYYKAYEIFESSNNITSIAGVGMRLARIEQKNDNLNAALRLVDAALISYDSLENLEGSYTANFSRSQLLKDLERYDEGMAALELAYDQRDSLTQIQYDSEVKDLQVKYETSLKDAEIIKQQNKIEKETRIRNFFRAIAALIGAVSLLVFFFMRNKLKQSKLLREQQSLIQSQKIEQLEKEKKILSMNAMIEGQEAERSRIAKDLHDGLGGLLSTVKAHFSNIQSEIQKIEKINVYNRANELVDEACDEVRRISHNLMPGALRLEGLSTAVEHLGEEMSSAHPFTVRVETLGIEQRMEESKEVFIYRIIQEALNNIIKHADASDVLIQLSETDDRYHFIVEDDGKGFDPLQIESGLGLKSIQSRVDFLKGSLDIDTKEGIGTTLSWNIPK